MQKKKKQNKDFWGISKKLLYDMYELTSTSVSRIWLIHYGRKIGVTFAYSFKVNTRPTCKWMMEVSFE